MRHADTYDYVMIAYFVIMFAVANWKGTDFLNIPSLKKKLIIALAIFLPLAAWPFIQHLR